MLNDVLESPSQSLLAGSEMEFTSLCDQVVHEAGIMILALNGYLAASKDDRPDHLRDALNDAADRVHDLAEMVAARASHRPPRWKLHPGLGALVG